MNGVELIAQERQRQIEKEGWTPEHDDEAIHGEMAIAGACYVFDLISSYKTITNTELSNDYWRIRVNLWPWHDRYFKPTWNDPIKELTKAGALIAAEIDRLQRLQENPSKRG